MFLFCWLYLWRKTRITILKYNFESIQSSYFFKFLKRLQNKSTFAGVIGGGKWRLTDYRSSHISGLSIHISMCLYIHLSIYPYIHYLYIQLSIYPYIHVSIYTTIYLFIYPTIPHRFRLHSEKLINFLDWVEFEVQKRHA